MAKTASEWIKNQIEERRRIVFPLAVTRGASLEKLDFLVETRNEIGMALFWKKRENISGLDMLDALSEELKMPREISLEDQELISKIVTESKNQRQVFNLSGSIGNFFQIENLYKKLENTDISLEVRIPLMFWSYLVIIESAINDLGEIFYEIALQKEDDEYTKEFENALEAGEHLLFGKLNYYAQKWGFTSKEKSTFLHKRNLRNEIAHANIWYDSDRKKIQIRGQEFMELNDFAKEFDRVFDFFKEFIFQINNQNENLSKEIENLIKYFEREFIKISRSGPKKKIWKNQIDFEWEKENPKA
jgi:hypothetical protein